MKRILLLLFLGAVTAIGLFAQSGNTKVAGKIYYTTIHVRDTVSGNSFTETSILFFGKGESLFRSFDYLQAIENTKKMQAGGKTTFGMVMGRGTSSRYYVNTAKNEISRVNAYGVSTSATTKTDYVMPEKNEKINWKIERATKKFGEYTCQKATTTFHGRNYTAWFCADIPYNFGPWKLNGLPGLIFEAQDDRQQVIFRFSKIEYPGTIDEYIEAPKNTVITTEKEFERMREASVNISSSPGISVSGSLTDAQGKPVAPPSPDKRLIPNPMDLVTRLPRLDMQ